MERRTFLSMVAGGLLALPLPAEAQQAGNVYRIGGLNLPPLRRDSYSALLREGLRELGYREGANITYSITGSPTDSPSETGRLAADLVRSGVDVIVTFSDSETLIAKRVTTSIPIIILSSVDPIGNGLVTNLARPGGNITGFALETGPELAGKRLELLKEAVPKLRSVAFLFNPAYPGMDGYVRVWKATTRSLNLSLQAFEVQTAADFGAAFSAIKAARPGALFVGEGWPTTSAGSRRIVEFAIQSKLPAMFVLPGYVEIGGLLAYLASDTERVQRAAALIDKILKGAKPGDLPMEQPTKFELVINLKTAKALGLTIPQSLLLRADEVIQ